MTSGGGSAATAADGMAARVDARPQGDGMAAQADPRRWLTLALVMTAAFMVLLDISIVNVAIPSIQANLGASFSDVQLVLAGYQLTYAVVLITGGRLGDTFGRKRFFIIGMVGFTLASALCGAAVSPLMLILSRVLQGLMASLMFPQVLSVIQVSFPPRERAAAFGTFGAIIGVATIAGPILGGVIIRDDITGSAWRFVFLVNVPIGLASVLAALRLMRETRSPTARRLDLPGVGLASIGLLLLVYPLIEGREADWAPWTYLMLAGSVLVLGAFLLFERRLSDRRGASPLVQMHMFEQRGFTVGTLVSLLFLMGVPAFFFTFSLVLQIGLGFTPLHAALTTVPFAVASAVGSAMSVRLSGRLGKRILMAGSGALVVGMAGLILTLHLAGEQVTSWDMVPSLVISGLGLGSVIAPLVNVILAGVHTDDAGSASGVVTTSQQVGGAIGVAVMGVIFFGVLGHHAGSVATQSDGSLRLTLARAEPHAPPVSVAKQVDAFDRCFVARSNAKDPQGDIPGCPRVSAGSRIASPVGQVFSDAGRSANARNFSDSMQVSLLYNIVVWTACLVLIALLPDPPRRAQSGPHPAAH